MSAHPAPFNRDLSLLAALAAAEAGWLYYALRTGADQLDALNRLSVELRVPLLALVAGVALLPAWLLWRRGETAVQRAAGRAWSWAAALMLWLGLTYFGPLENDQLTALLNLLGLLLFLAGLLWHLRRAGVRLAFQRAALGRWLLGLGPAAPLAYPWLAWGALGSPLDAALGALTAALLGVVAALLLEHKLLAPLRTAGASPLTVAVTAALLLALCAAALRFDYYVLTLLLLVVLAGAGLLVARLRGQPTSLLAGVLAGAALGPLLLADPEELWRRGHWLTGARLDWATAAAWLSVLIAVLVAALLPRLLRFSRASSPLTVGLAVLVYAALGRPGFYGEHVFMVLAARADLAPAAALLPADRRAAVYQALTQTALTSQAPARAWLDRFRVPFTAHYLVNGFDLTADPWQAWLLARQAPVARVVRFSVDRPAPWAAPETVETGDAPPPTGVPAHLQLIHADRVWRELGVTGQGVTLASMDRAVQWDHPELAANFRGRGGDLAYAWFDPEFGTVAPTLGGAHGTHALAAAVGQQVGVAPGAEWFFCRLGSTLAQRLSCLEFEFAPWPPGADPFTAGDPARGADVSTNSWECGLCDRTLLQPAAAALRAGGLFVAVAGGNTGPTCASLRPPLAPLPEVFTVGVVQADGQLMTWSSRGPGLAGPKPDVVAPGVLILSAAPGSTYAEFSGSSFAAPQVAGVVALMWSANPALKGDVPTTEALLRQTAHALPGNDPLCQADPANTAGAGLVDAFAAVQAAQTYHP